MTPFRLLGGVGCDVEGARFYRDAGRTANEHSHSCSHQVDRGQVFRTESFPASAVLIGSVAPDIPLYFLSIGGGLWFRIVQGWDPAEIHGGSAFTTCFIRRLS